MTKENFMENAISPIDGRYFEKSRPLASYFSEGAFMKYRTMVECEFLIFLSGSKITGLRKFSDKEVKIVRNLYANFSEESYREIKGFEKTINHDVKAVEYFIKDKLGQTSLKDIIEWVHFGLTSEDTNNCAYGIMLGLSLRDVILPELKNIEKHLAGYAQKYADLPMLARTHGQGASPTTLGKEFAVFKARLYRQVTMLESFQVSIKLNGATGNYNAFVAAYPKGDWLSFSKKFVGQLISVCNIPLAGNLVTTQIEPHDTYAELSDILRRINTILLDINQDIWRYVSDGYLVQKPKEDEVGSSTMPHKVNPIDFENSEGNLGLANALFNFFSTKLPISRLQRDLSDSTVERSIGTAFAYSYIAYLSMLKGLSKVDVNKEKISAELLAHPEVIAEGIQTILRRENYPVPYEALKDLTRGKIVSMGDFEKFINTLEVSPKIKADLRKITPLTYIGLAAKIAIL